METVRNTIGENFTGGNKVVNPEHEFHLEGVPSQKGKVAVVTGGSEGIGYAFTHTLLSRGISRLIVLSLSKEVVDGAVDAIRGELGDEAASKTKWIQCDMSDWNRVAEVAKEITSLTDRLDILFNNAARGIMTAQLTEYGVDRHMAVNHMGHVIFTSHLMPLLKKTAETDTVRIVNMASNAHIGAPSNCKFASLQEVNQDAGPNGQYGRSKLAAILYSRYLNRHLTSTHPNILVNATHPGFVRTKMSTVDIHEPYPLAGYGMSAAMAPFQKDQFEGCLSALYAATMTNKSGEYICPPAVPEPGSEPSQDEALGEQLMKLTKEIVDDKTKATDKGCPMTFY